jgi:hypothetical protein
MKLMDRFRAGTVHRLRRILLEAPWSNHDLLSGLILGFIGLLLLVNPELYTSLRTLNFIAHQGHLAEWSLFFLLSGLYGLGMTLWCIAPPFLVRLMARMLYAFCFLTLAFSSLQFSITPSAITFSILAVWSIWGILRTHESGR